MTLAEALHEALSGHRGGDLAFHVRVGVDEVPQRKLVGTCGSVNRGPVGDVAAGTVLFEGFSSILLGRTNSLRLNYVYRPEGWNNEVRNGVRYRLVTPGGETPYPEVDLPDLG